MFGIPTSPPRHAGLACVAPHPFLSYAGWQACPFDPLVFGVPPAIPPFGFRAALDAGRVISGRARGSALFPLVRLAGMPFRVRRTAGYPPVRHQGSAGSRQRNLGPRAHFAARVVHHGAHDPKQAPSRYSPRQSLSPVAVAISNTATCSNGAVRAAIHDADHAHEQQQQQC